MAYVTVQDLRDFGLTEETASDQQVAAAIVLWSQVIDKICGQWFEPRAVTFRLDGSGSDVLHLPVPIISISSLKVNGESVALASDRYVAYTNRVMPDDRLNPRIRLGNAGSYWTGSGPFYAVGIQNQSVTGIFGYVEEDLSTPAPIKYALMKLISEKLKNPPNANEDLPPDENLGLQGPVIEETTDGHSRKWANVSVKMTRPGIASGITSDPEINAILLMYRRAPMILVTGRS